MTEADASKFLWSRSDIMRDLYGDDESDPWTWERIIIDELLGKVPLRTALIVVRAAHNAYREGVSAGMSDS